MELKKIEDKRSIEKQLYGHLPYYNLFAQHQGDYLNESDWLKIISIIEKGIINKAKLILEEKESYNFCSCYEGDLYERYKIGVAEFLDELTNN